MKLNKKIIALGSLAIVPITVVTAVAVVYTRPHSHTTQKTDPDLDRHLVVPATKIDNTTK